MKKRTSAELKRRTGADMRAQRDQRLAQPYELQEAGRREASFLKNITGAQDDLEWILTNRAWTQLGFERVAEWWDARVGPVLDGLDLKPSAAMVERVIRTIVADEAELPKVQRRTQREIASIARTNPTKVSRSLHVADATPSDLDETAADRLESAAADGGEGLAFRPTDPPAADAGASVPASAVTPDPPGISDQSTGLASFADESARPGPQSSSTDPMGVSVDAPAGPQVPPFEGRPGADTSVELTPRAPDVAPEGEAGAPEEDHRGSSSGTYPWSAFGDPAGEFVVFVEVFTERLALVDPDTLGPLLTEEQLGRIDRAADEVAHMAGLLRRWHDR